jgi:hypothetical protein
MKTRCRCEIRGKDGACCRGCQDRHKCPQACLIASGELPQSECRGGDIYGEVE